jgi:hypothetical protein
MHQSDFWQDLLVKKLAQCKVSTQRNMPPSKIQAHYTLHVGEYSISLRLSDHYNFIKYILSINIQTEIIMLKRLTIMYLTQYTDFTKAFFTFKMP